MQAHTSLLSVIVREPMNQVRYRRGLLIKGAESAPKSLNRAAPSHETPQRRASCGQGRVGSGWTVVRDLRTCPKRLRGLNSDETFSCRFLSLMRQ